MAFALKLVSGRFALRSISAKASFHFMIRALACLCFGLSAIGNQVGAAELMTCLYYSHGGAIASIEYSKNKRRRRLNYWYWICY